MTKESEYQSLTNKMVNMKVITGHDGGNHPIYEQITLFFMSDGTVRWEV